MEGHSCYTALLNFSSLGYIQNRSNRSTSSDCCVTFSRRKSVKIQKSALGPVIAKWQLKSRKFGCLKFPSSKQGGSRQLINIYIFLFYGSCFKQINFFPPSQFNDQFHQRIKVDVEFPPPPPPFLRDFCCPPQQLMTNSVRGQWSPALMMKRGEYQGW